jgi:transposase
MLGSQWNEAASRLPAHSRIRLLVWRCQPEGWNLRLSHYAASDTECFQIFLETLANKYPRQLILLFVDGAGNHHSDELEVPANIMLHFLPPYSPELNPQENLWDEIREKIFKNYALKSLDEVYAKLEEAAVYIERNPALVKSITSFPYIARSI